jgi:ribosomal protein S18 acetylase RimI-like enzyme
MQQPEIATASKISFSGEVSKVRSKRKFNNMLEIKKAGTNDIPLIRSLAMKVWPGTYIPIIGEDQVAYMLDRFYSDAALQEQMARGDTFIVCYDAGQPVGFASFGPVEPDTYKLHKLYILPQTQGKGIGKLLLDHIKNAVKTAGNHRLHLNVNRYNEGAKGFYARMGFTVVKDEDIDIGNGFYMNDHVLGITV